MKYDAKDTLSADSLPISWVKESTMSLPRPSDSRRFTHLHACITQEDGAYTLGIQLRNHQTPNEVASGMQEAASLELASAMIADVAAQFGILQPEISINIVMENFRDGTRH